MGNEIGATCTQCGKELIASVGDITYEDGGICVVLKDSRTWSCPGCEDQVLHEIPNLAGLHLTIGLNLAESDSRLQAAEFRFLRKSLGLSVPAFAHALGVAKSTLSEWEQGKKVPSLASEKHLRRTYLLAVTSTEDCRDVDICAIEQAIGSLEDREQPRSRRIELSFFGGIPTLTGGRPVPPGWLTEEQIKTVKHRSLASKRRILQHKAGCAARSREQ